jgi:hypothetical protein
VRFEGVGIANLTHDISTMVIRPRDGDAVEVIASTCPLCHQVVIDIPRILTGGGGQRGGPGIVFPRGATRPVPSEVSAAAESLANDFREAVAVLPSSRKASAALARRCLQYVLVHAAKVTKRDLADQIDEVLPKLPAELAANVDAIRHVGNYAAHPMKSTNTGEVVEVEEGEAEWLLDVLEELFEFYYVAPAQAAAKREALNKKLADLRKPPLKQPPG